MFCFLLQSSTDECKHYVHWFRRNRCYHDHLYYLSVLAANLATLISCIYMHICVCVLHRYSRVLGHFMSSFAFSNDRTLLNKLTSHRSQITTNLHLTSAKSSLETYIEDASLCQAKWHACKQIEIAKQIGKGTIARAFIFETI